MKTFVLNLLALLGFTLNVNAQTCRYSGVLKDKQTNEPIPYSSIYISSISKGMMTNANGEFAIDLPCKNYEAKIQSLGYETQFVKLQENQTIYLTIKDNVMAEVTVSAKSEDPAYYIMRKAIVMAEFYSKQIKKYSCDIYLKDVFEVEKTPDILKLFSTEEEIAEMKTGQMSETYLTYQFEHPNIINETIISKRSTYQDTSNSASNYLNLNFYNIGNGQIISPLSKNAFQVYKFHLEDSYDEGNVRVRKIKIIPKREGQDLMSGYIYINDGLWNINRVDIKFKQNMLDVIYHQFYSEVKDITWFPVGSEITVEAKLLGFEGYYKYLASISSIQTENDSLVDEKIHSLIDAHLILKEEKLGDKKSTENLSKTEQKINELMAKDQLTKGDALKMMRLIEKQQREEEKKSDEKKSLEVPLTQRKTEYVDSAFKQTENAWDTLRAVPLTEKERSLYVKNDSIRNAPITESDSTKNRRQPKGTLGKILLNNSNAKLKNKNIEFKLPGLLITNAFFNPVDGYLLDRDLFIWKYNFKSQRRIGFIPTAQYSFARKTFMGNLNISSFYAPKARGSISINVGKLNDDFNNNNPMSALMNTITTLTIVDSYKRLYNKEFLNISNTIDVTNGLTLSNTFEFAKRFEMQNNSTYKMFNPYRREYSENIPFQGIDSTLVQSHTASFLKTSLSYTPQYYFRLDGRKKVMLYSKYPTFTATITQGLKGLMNSITDYTLAEFSVSQSKKFGLIDNINYYVGTGKFISKNTIKFADFKHFNTIPFLLGGRTSTNTFRLLNYYTSSSSDYYVEAHLGIEDNNILLKRIPFFGRKAWTESLRTSFLTNENTSNYIELGYGLNKLFLFLNLEAYVSFYNYQYQSFGAKILLNFGTNNQN